MKNNLFRLFLVVLMLICSPLLAIANDNIEKYSFGLDNKYKLRLDIGIDNYIFQQKNNGLSKNKIIKNLEYYNKLIINNINKFDELEKSMFSYIYINFENKIKDMVNNNIDLYSNGLTDFLESTNSYGFIVWKNDKILYEHYYDERNSNTKGRIFSAGKSFGAVFIGIAQSEGFLNINDKVSKYLGEGRTKTDKNNESKIKIYHLLSMNSGLTTSLDFEAEPGEVWNYNTKVYHKIYDILEEATGMSRDKFAKDYLFSKISMDNTSFTFAGNTYKSTTEDMLKFGKYILSEIKGNGLYFSDSNYLKSMLNSSQDLNKSYGYLWWLNGKDSYMLPNDSKVYNGSLIPNAPSDLLSALGMGDKKIYISPSKNLVVIRYGDDSGVDSKLAISSFDNKLWSYLTEL